VAFSGRDTATPITPTMKECFCFDSVSITFVHIAGAHAFRDQFFFGYELLSCLSMCNVGVLWSNGWMDQDATWFGGRPRPRRHCVRCKLSAPPPPERGTKAPFSVHCFGKVAHLSNCRASDLVNVNAATINYKFTILSHVTISPWFLSTK